MRSIVTVPALLPSLRALLLALLLAQVGCSNEAPIAQDGGADASVDDGGEVERDASADAARDAPEDTLVADGGCVATSVAETACDGVDEDCNGLTDDLDVGGDGIYDCMEVAFLGAASSSYPASNFAAWLAEQNGGTVDRRGVGEHVLDAALLAPYDVVVLDQLERTYSADEASALAAWVGAGGGVIVLTGYTGGAQDYERPNSLLVPLGVSYVGGLRNGPVVAFAEHPTTSGLSSITFNGGFAVEATSPDAITIAELPGEPAAHAAMVVEHGSGRVLVWGDEWIVFDSEWTALPEVTTLWIQFLGWSAGLR